MNVLILPSAWQNVLLVAEIRLLQGGKGINKFKPRMTLMEGKNLPALLCSFIFCDFLIPDDQM